MKNRFKIKGGLYECLVMSSGLLNFPSNNVWLMNHVFKTLNSNLKKCSFFTQEVTFLGYIVITQGIKVGESKVKGIQSWLI